MADEAEGGYLTDERVRAAWHGIARALALTH
jgi:hypothetical protein